MPVDQLSLTTNNKFSYNQFMLGDYSKLVPPDPISNSEVKQFSAYDSVIYHAKVGHRQALIPKSPAQETVRGFFIYIDQPKQQKKFKKDTGQRMAISSRQSTYFYYLSSQ